MASTKSKYQEKAGFDEESMLRKPIGSHIEREHSGANRKIFDDPKMNPVIDDSKEPNDNEIYEDNYVAQNDAEEHSVDNQLMYDQLYMSLDPHIRYDMTRRSPSREKDSSALNPPDKNEKVRLRKTVKPDKKSRKSPNHKEDPPELSPLDKKVKPPRKDFMYDKPSKQNLCAMKTSPVSRFKYNLEYTPECAVSSRIKDVSIVRIIVLVLGLIFAGYAIKELLSSDSPEKRVTFNYQSIVSSFQHSFKGQPVFSFKIFKSALNSINKTDPSAPAVILFLASKGAEELAHSLGEKLVNSVSPSPIKISGKDYEMLDTDSGKKIIDDALRSMISSDSEYGAVLVEDLHRIPGETALMFHTYCDNENAPYKHAVYVLIVHMEEPIPVNSKMKDWDIAVYKRLNRAWSDIDEDQRSPLLSRLTVSVAAIVENDITL